MPILRVKHNDVWEEVAGVSGHVHTISDIVNLPSSLPTDVETLKIQVGSGNVDDRIEAAVSTKSDSDHTHDNMNLFNTISGVDALYIPDALAGYPVEIALSSDVYTDFSDISVTLIGDGSYATAIATSDGVVSGLVSKESFTVKVNSSVADFDATKVNISCTYQYSLDTIMQDYVLNVDDALDGITDGNDYTNNVTTHTIIDNTLSIVGAAADARATGDAIKLVNDRIDNIDSDSSNYIHPDTHPATMITGLATVATTGDFNDLINKPDNIGDSNIVISDTYDATSSDAMSGKAVAQALETVSGNSGVSYTHPETHPANMITGLANVAISGDYNDLANQPSIPNIDGLATETYVNEKIASIGKVVEQVQSDWNETDETSPAYIKNKPSISGGDGGGGGTSVQADWNQTDSTQLDYIKNRPFYDYEGLVEVLPLINFGYFALDSTSGVYSYGDYYTYDLIAGETYIISWDGVDYECVAQDASSLASGVVMVGNVSNFGLSGNNEPFAIVVMSGQGVMYASLTDTEEGNYHDIGIKKRGILSKQLDNRYLNFIKNGTVNILPFTTYSDFALNNMFGIYYTTGNPDFILKIGETYKVIWDGINYECVAQDASTVLGEGVVIVGDASAFGLSGNGEPFIIGVNTYAAIYASLTDTEDGGIHDVCISKNYDIIKEEYLPEISSLPEITTDDNGKVLGIVDGSWTVTSWLPDITTDDNNKVLKVVEGAWTVSDSLPEVTTNDDGKFLRVVNGVWAAETVLNAEEASF